MKTLVLEKPGEIRLTETTPPPDPPPGFARIKIHRVGICGTDWNAFHGRQPFFTYPRILGHELGVTIEAINDSKTNLKIGDKCSVEPYMNCGTCIACRNGKTNCCPTLLCLGVHTDGGMREHINVPLHKLHKSDKLTLEQLALVETLAIGCHAINRAAVKKDEWVLIFGAGPIGLSIIPFAQVAGAKIIVADISENRLRFCRDQLHVDHTIDARTDILSKLKVLTNNDLPTLVMDATGNAASMNRCFDLIAPGGRIVFVGIVQENISFSDPHLHKYEITAMASRNALASDFTRIIGMIESGQIDTTPWITHQCDCTKLVENVPSWLKPDSGLVKAIVEF